jgi:hypothetical protein
MTKQVQRRRGTSSQHTSFTGAEGEISVNTTNKSIHVHDGTTAGGIEAARADLGNVSDANLNSALAGNTLSSLTITSADINGGTIDGTVIGGSAPAAMSGTTGTFSGNLTAGGNVLFQEKISMSGGSRGSVQIGSPNAVSGISERPVSYGNNLLAISDPSDTTASIWSQPSTNIGGAALVMTADNGDFGSFQFFATQDQDIATSVVERMRIDSSGLVGINTSSPVEPLHVVGTVRSDVSSTGDFNFAAYSTGGGQYRIYPDDATTASPTWLHQSNSAEDQAWIIGGVERMRVDASGGVGIGKTASTGIKLDVEGKLNLEERLTVDFSGASGSVFIGDGASSSTSNRYIALYSDNGLRLQTRTDAGVFVSNDYIVETNATGASAHRWHIANSESMRIDPSGSVGIGTSDPLNILHAESTGATAVNFSATDAQADANTSIIAHNNTNNNNAFTQIVLRQRETNQSDVRLVAYGGDNPKFAIASQRRLTGSEYAAAHLTVLGASGNVGIGTEDPAFALDVQDTGDTVLRVKAKSSGAGNDDDAILRLDSAETGEGLIDFFHQGVSEAGIEWASSLKQLNIKTAAGTDGVIDLQPNDNVAVRVQDPTSDGLIMGFYSEAGTYSGGIGHQDNDLWIGEGAVGLQFQLSGDDRIDPFNTDTNSVRDNAIDLGGLNSRFDDIYATNGTIQTSDRNEKQDIEALSDAEQRVAVACKGLLRKFRWKDAVAERGDNARIHFGIIAQDLQDAFAAEGLDAGRYAMFIHSTWVDKETGEERSRMGVRYPQLLAFIIAAI